MPEFDLSSFLGDMDLSAFQGQFRDPDELQALRGVLGNQFALRSPSSPQMGKLESRRLGKLGATDKFMDNDLGFGQGPAGTNFLSNQQPTPFGGGR